MSLNFISSLLPIYSLIHIIVEYSQTSFSDSIRRELKEEKSWLVSFEQQILQSRSARQCACLTFLEFILVIIYIESLQKQLIVDKWILLSIATRGACVTQTISKINCHRVAFERGNENITLISLLCMLDMIMSFVHPERQQIRIFLS